MNQVLVVLRVFRTIPQRSWPIAVALALTMVSVGNTPTFAQSSTPPVLEVASDCSLVPLDLPLFGGTPAAALLATPAATSVDLANLEPVNAETESAVREGVAKLMACVNTGEPRRAYAIFTTEYLAATYGDPTRAYLPAFERALDAAPTHLTTPFAIDSLTVEGGTPDGRVVISLTVSADGTSWASMMVLKDVDGTWLIDAVLP